MTYTVVFSAAAETDLFAIYDYIAERAGHAIALRFVESI
jgi:plasmid stabilization system protein ParE